VKCEQHRRRVVIRNDKRLQVRKVRIDGCVITDGPRCDFLVLVADRPDEVYIELKGRDIAHAVEQLEATIAQVSADKARVAKICYVACSHVPKMQTAIQRHATRFARHYNARLHVKSNYIEHVL
jgi:hypothetical protein